METTIRAINTHWSTNKKMEIFKLDIQARAKYPGQISLLKPVVPDDKVGVAIVDPGLHRPLPPLDVASAPHQGCHRPLSRSPLRKLAVCPSRLLTT